MSQSKLMSEQHFVQIESIKAKVSEIAQKYQPEKIILLGSYAAGNPITNSDVDLMVIFDTEQSTCDIGAEISLMLKHELPMDI